MIIFASESKANIVFANYKNAAAFNLALTKKSKKTEGEPNITYQALPCLPDDDTINAVIDGAKSGKKVIEKAIKALRKGPSVKNAGLAIGMIQLVTMLTNTSKSKKGDPILVFVYDDEEDATAKKARKFLTKYMKALFGAFGITKFYTDDDVNDIFASKKSYRGEKMGSKKAKKAALKNVNKKNTKSGNHLSTKGISLQKQLKICYDVEIRNSAMFDIDNKYVKMYTKPLIKALLMAYTATNLQKVDDKVAKALSEKDKEMVKSYKTFVKLMKAMAEITGKKFDMPEVKYGQKKKGHGKHKHAVGAKMKVNKFAEYFEKSSKRGLLPMIYAHTACEYLGVDVGTNTYNKNMADIIVPLYGADTAKAFVTAAKAYNKAKKEAEAAKKESK